LLAQPAPAEAGVVGFLNVYTQYASSPSPSRRDIIIDLEKESFFKAMVLSNTENE
jgi:hypothetical protein